MSWYKETRALADVIYNKIISMPFNQELMNGTLHKDKFQFYIEQDSLYLLEFSRAMAIIAGRSNKSETILQFIHFAENGIIVESALHEGYLSKTGKNLNLIASPVCQHYTQFLLATAALDQIEVAMAATLPCFSIYKENGDKIHQNQNNISNPYQAWINTYAGEEFGVAVNKAISRCDEVAASCSESQRQSMTNAFIIACKLEWMFWDSAFRLEGWQV